MINRIFYGWWVTLACSLIGLYAGGVIFFGFTAFIQPIAEEFGWSYTQISFAVSLRGLEMGIFAPFVGFLVDRFGPRKIIFWGILTIGIGLFLLSVTQSLAMFFLVPCIWGWWLYRISHHDGGSQLVSQKGRDCTRCNGRWVWRRWNSSLAYRSPYPSLSMEDYPDNPWIRDVGDRHSFVICYP